MRAHRAPAAREHWSGTTWESCYDSGIWQPFPRPLASALGQFTRCANESGGGSLRADGWLLTAVTLAPSGEFRCAWVDDGDPLGQQWLQGHWTLTADGVQLSAPTVRSPLLCDITRWRLEFDGDHLRLERPGLPDSRFKRLTTIERQRWAAEVPGVLAPFEFCAF